MRYGKWSSRSLYPALSVLLLGLALPSAARTIVYEGSIRNQTVQESAKARLKLTIDGERLSGYLTTYPPLQGSGPVSGIRRGDKCVLSVAIDEDALMELRGACRDGGFDGGYAVNFEGNYRQQRGSFLLKPVAGTRAGEPTAVDKSRGRLSVGVEGMPPIGDYGVYQHTGTTGYDFIYRLRFLNEREYLAYNNTKGSYAYEPKTRQFTFQTGPLVDVVGSYMTQEAGGVGRPKILLRSKTSPPPIDAATLREYLYAFFRPEGIQ